VVVVVGDDDAEREVVAGFGGGSLEGLVDVGGGEGVIAGDVGGCGGGGGEGHCVGHCLGGGWVGGLWVGLVWVVGVRWAWDCWVGSLVEEVVLFLAFCW